MGNLDRRIVSEYLCPNPSALRGTAHFFDFMGQFTVYNLSPTTPLADGSATFADWAMIGQDLADAIESYKTTAELPR